LHFQPLIPGSVYFKADPLSDLPGKSSRVVMISKDCGCTCKPPVPTLERGNQALSVPVRLNAALVPTLCVGTHSGRSASKTGHESFRYLANRLSACPISLKIISNRVLPDGPKYFDSAARKQV